MNIFYMSFTAGILIIVIMLLRLVAMNKLPKTMFLVLWGIVMTRLLLPVGFSIQIPFLFQTEARKQFSALGSRVEQSAVILNGSIEGSKHAETIFTLHNFYVLWGVGILFIVAVTVFRYIRDYRRLQESLPCDKLEPFVSRLKRVVGVKMHIALRSADFITSPITYGILHPTIVFPKGFDRGTNRELEYMVMHELVHIKRKDVFWKMISLATLCIHWFNPLVWLMFYVFNRDLEISCDDSVLKIVGEEEREQYAMTLIRMAEHRTRMDIVCCGFGKNLIEERIVSIMKHKKVTIVASLCACAIIAGSFTIFANVNATKQDERSASDVIEEVQVSAYPTEEAATDETIEEPEDQTTAAATWIEPEEQTTSTEASTVSEEPTYVSLGDEEELNYTSSISFTADGEDLYSCIYNSEDGEIFLITYQKDGEDSTYTSTITDDEEAIEKAKEDGVKTISVPVTVKIDDTNQLYWIEESAE